MKARVGACVALLTLAACGGDDEGGASGPPAIVIREGAGALVRARIEGADFSATDDDAATFRMTVDGASVTADPTTFGVFAIRSPDAPATITAVVVQARIAAKEGASVVVERPATGDSWSFTAHAQAGQSFPVHPIILRAAGADTARAEADISDLGDGWMTVRDACGSDLTVSATEVVEVDDPGALGDGVESLDDGRIIVPDRIDDALAQISAPDDELRVLLHPGDRALLAVTPEVFEFAPKLFFAPPVVLYDHIANDALVGQHAAPRGQKYNLVVAYEHAPPHGRWTWPLLTAHEIGHMLGLVHPPDTKDTSDDFSDNLMAGAHSFPGLHAKGSFAFVTQRQCIEMSLDLNGYGR